MSLFNMRIWPRVHALLLACAALPVAAGAQQLPSASGHPLELAGGYTYVHSNAPAPGGCGCFALQGGNVSVALHYLPSWAFVGQVERSHASNILASTQTLTLTTYQVGLHFAPARLRFQHFTLFSEVLGGAARTSSNYTFNDGNVGLSIQLGGGLDVPLSPRVSLRPAQADYLSTHIANGGANFQNNFRFSSGLVLRLR